MVAIAKGLTKHTVVLVVDKRERAIGMQSILNKIGYRVIVALSLYDALKTIAQEMPHLVITEALLSDGSAGSMYDRLQQHPTLKKTPIIVNVLRKTKDELNALGQRKFSGFLLGKPETKSFVGKLSQVMAGCSQVSPHFISIEDHHLEKKAIISLAANVVGRKGDFMISRSHMELDSKASLICSPDDKNLKPAVVRMPSNLEDEDGAVNLFPINRIIGSGRHWIEELPEIDQKNPALEPEKKSVIFYDPSEERYKQFAEILKGYDIELIYVPSLARAASFLKRDLDSVGCVYLHELLNDASAIEWKKVYSQIPEGGRPPMVIGTTSQNARSIAGLSYIKRPFGLGVFIQTLEAAFERSDEITKGAESTGYKGVSVRFQAPAQLIGLDETGGILEIKFPVYPGCKIDIENAFLDLAWAGNRAVKAIAVASVPGKAHTWQIRFEAGIASATNKSKYWERICAALNEAAPDTVSDSA